MNSSQDTLETEKEIQRLYEQAKILKKKLPKKFKRKVLPQSISPEDFAKILSQVNIKKESGKVDRIAFLLAYESGLRISEVIKLQKLDINLTQKSIFIRDAKFAKDRVVPLPATWKGYMMDYIPIGKGARALQRSFKRYCKRAEVNPIYHFHSLRHSFATRCLESGMPINQVSMLMGHASIGTTNVYVQANPVSALNKYQELFGQ
jgi:integrase/recombinase XerD